MQFSLYRQPFTATLSCAKQHVLGEPVTCKFTITNTHKENLYLLKRGTPLEGLVTDFVTIIRDEKSKIRYDGIIIRSRATYSQDEFVLLEAGSSLTTAVDLTSAYPFHIAADYAISLACVVAYYTEDKNVSKAKLIHSPLKSPVETIKVYKHYKEPIKTVGQLSRQTKSRLPSEHFKGSSASGPIPPVIRGDLNEEETKKAFSIAFQKVQRAIGYVDSNPQHYKEWFGDAEKAEVKRFYQAIKNSMLTSHYTFQFDGNADEHIYAYTHYGSTTIYLCGMYKKAPLDSGSDTKYGTMVHELSHAVDYTEDIDYGQANSEQLAENDPDDAAYNADNYEYFVEGMTS